MTHEVKLSDGEKLILLMLCNLHEKLKIDDEGLAESISSAIYDGNLWSLKWKYTGIFHNSEPTEEEVSEAADIMDMWMFLERFYEGLSPEDKELVKKEAEPFGDRVRFEGFDGNGESEYIGIARCLVDKLDRFQTFKGRELNAHFPTLEMHRRMMEVYTPMRKGMARGGLSAREIAAILKAQTYPE